MQQRRSLALRKDRPHGECHEAISADSGMSSDRAVRTSKIVTPRSFPANYAASRAASTCFFVGCLNE